MAEQCDQIFMHNSVLTSSSIISQMSNQGDPRQQVIERSEVFREFTQLFMCCAHATAVQLPPNATRLLQKVTADERIGGSADSEGLQHEPGHSRHPCQRSTTARPHNGATEQVDTLLLLLLVLRVQPEALVMI